jgi:hypothetical protein
VIERVREQDIPTWKTDILPLETNYSVEWQVVREHKRKEVKGRKERI